MSQQQQHNVYGGDEIAALVLDPGSYNTRAGFAGEDTPRCVVSACVGTTKSSLRNSKSNKKELASNDTYTCFDESNLLVARPDFEIKQLWENETITNWEDAANQWRWCFEKQLSTDITASPIIMTEPNSTSFPREKYLEMLFEDFGTPAAFLSKQAVCAAFANGKPNALIVDVGHSHATAAAVLDGYILQRSLQSQSYAGSWLNSNIQAYLQNEKIDCSPRYLVKEKAKANSKKPVLRDLKGVTKSFHQFQLQCLMNQFKEEFCWVSDNTNTTIEKTFEFPSGHILASSVGCELVEPLFTPCVENQLGITRLAQNAIDSCDVDLRAGLLNNVVLTGGTTLLQHFSERFTNELTDLYPGSKIRIHASTNSIERKFGSWTGASILASLGTFHQLWISREEYDEAGADRLGLLERRCR